MNKQEYLKKFSPLFKRVVHEIGESGATLGKKLGVTRQTISYWYATGVNPGRCHELSDALHGIITPDLMRPDIFMTEEERENVGHLAFWLAEKVILERLEAWKNGQSGLS